MSSPYSGATPAGSPQGYATPTTPPMVEPATSENYGADYSGYMVLMFLSFALWWALENLMDAGLAALIVAVLWGIVGAVAFVMGKKKFQQVNPKPERTVETLH